MDHFAGPRQPGVHFFYIQESLSSNNKVADTLVFYVKRKQKDAMDYECLSLLFILLEVPLNEKSRQTISIHVCFTFDNGLTSVGKILNVYVKRNRCNGLHTDSSDARFGHVSHVHI